MKRSTYRCPHAQRSTFLSSPSLFLLLPIPNTGVPFPLIPSILTLNFSSSPCLSFRSFFLFPVHLHPAPSTCLYTLYHIRGDRAAMHTHSPVRYSSPYLWESHGTVRPMGLPMRSSTPLSHHRLDRIHQRNSVRPDQLCHYISPQDDHNLTVAHSFTRYCIQKQPWRSTRSVEQTTDNYCLQTVGKTHSVYTVVVVSFLLLRALLHSA